MRMKKKKRKDGKKGEREGGKRNSEIEKQRQ